MERHLPGLASQLVQLRASATPAEAGCGTVSAALDALIAALFARIFAQLEQLLTLWQSGDLPPPAIRPAATPKPPPRQNSPRRAARYSRRTSRKAPTRPNTPKIRPAIPRAKSRVDRRARQSAPSYFRPRPARAPPNSRQRCRLSPSPGNAEPRPN